MPQANDIRTFDKGMNKDVDPRFLKPGEYIHAENLINNNHVDGRVGSLTNLPGISRVDADFLINNHSGDRPVFMLDDNQNDDIYIFIASGTASYRDRIVKYNTNTSTTTMVVYSSGLLFSPLRGLKSAIISDGILVWTDGVNEIGMFDQSVNYLELAGLTEYAAGDQSVNYLELAGLTEYAAGSYTSGDKVSYENIVYIALVTGSLIAPTGTLEANQHWAADTNDEITPEMLTLGKLVPQQQPDVIAVADTTYKSNNIIGKFFQFKYRFVYANNQRSVFSPISDVVYSRDDYASPETVAANPNQTNAIDITLTGEGVNPLVVAVEIAARSGNLGDFFLIKKLDADSTFLAGGEQTLRFYNEGLYDPIDLNESNQIHDDIPLSANTLTFINNRVVTGDNVSGYDPVPVEYILDVEYSDGIKADRQNADTAGTDELSDSDGSTLEAFFLAEFGYSALVVGDILRCVGSTTGTYIYDFGDLTITVETGDTWELIVSKFLNTRWDHPIIPYVELDSFLTTDTSTHPSYGVQSVGNDVFSFTLEQGQHELTFKGGAWYNVGLQYFDLYGRTNGTNVQENSKVYIKTIGERDTTQDEYFNVGAAKIKVTILNEAPEWAVYYKIVYSRADVYNQTLQITTRGAEVVASSNNISLDIGSIDDWNDEKGGNLGYVWEKGDKIRLITREAGGDDIFTDWVTGLVEAEIIGANPTGGMTTSGYALIIPPMFGWSQALTVTYLETGATIEIFRPSKQLESADTIYSEASMFHKISFGGTTYIHEGDVDQTDGNTPGAEVTILGDAYIKNREDSPYGTGALKDNIAFESYDISDYRDSEHYSKGRATGILNQKQTRKFATLMYSEVVIPNTDINNLNRFYPDVNFEEYNKSFGYIVHLYNEGDHILMLQQDKVSKVFVDKSVTYDNQGNAQLLGTETRVLSDSVPYQGKYGIHDPRSFRATGGNRYWLDPYRGIVVRLSNSGIDKISKYGMKGWFADACKDLLTRTDPDTYSVLDVFHNSYMIMVDNRIGPVIFDEDSNSWIGFVSRFLPAHSVAINNKVFYTSGPDLYEMHDDNVNKNTIDNNTPVESSIQFVSNIEPTMLKNYMALVIDGTHALDVEIETESLAGGTNQQSTLDRDLDFTQKEQEHHAPFLRDINTPKLDPDMLTIDWANRVLFLGDTIKGKDAKITLTLPVAVADEDMALKTVEVVVSKG